jgi:hypothetical protein
MKIIFIFAIFNCLSTQALADIAMACQLDKNGAPNLYKYESNIIFKNRVYRKYEEHWKDFCQGHYGPKLGEDLPLRDNRGWYQVVMQKYSIGENSAYCVHGITYKINDGPTFTRYLKDILDFDIYIMRRLSGDNEFFDNHSLYNEKVIKCEKIP